VVDIDEFLYLPGLLNRLKRYQAEGITAIPALSYQMLSDQFPTENTSLPKMIRRGVPSLSMSKLGVLNPEAIQEVNFAVGNHSANPTGHVRYPETDELLLLHYKYLNRSYVQRRHAELLTKRGSVDLENRWGYHYSWDEQQLDQQLQDFAKTSREVLNSTGAIIDDFDLHADLWWRLPNEPEPPEEKQKSWRRRLLKKIGLKR